MVHSPKEPPPPPPPEKDWSEVESDVQHLTAETFKSFTKKKKHVLVMFYAPCKYHVPTVRFHSSAQNLHSPNIKEKLYKWCSENW